MDEQTPEQQIPQTPFGGMNIPFYQPGTPINEPTKVEITVDTPQVIEKIVYKKPRIHGFFRTLTIIALLVVGILMLLENYNIVKLSIAGFTLDMIYPIIVIFSTIIIRSYRWILGKIFWLILFLWVVGGFFGISTYTSLNPSTKSKFGDYIHYTVPSWDTTGIVLSDVRITTFLGNFDIKWTETKNLAEWTYKSDRNLLLTTWIKLNSDYLFLQEDPNVNLLQNVFSNLSLGVNRSRPVNIYLKNMLWTHHIDLSDIAWFKTKIHGGIQDLAVTLWENLYKDNALEIQLVGGKIVLNVPQNIGVKLYFNQWAWSLTLTDFDSKGKGYFESKNIGTAEKVANISVNAWISTFTLLWK